MTVLPILLYNVFDRARLCASQWGGGAVPAAVSRPGFVQILEVKLESTPALIHHLPLSDIFLLYLFIHLLFNKAFFFNQHDAYS